MRRISLLLAAAVLTACEAPTPPDSEGAAIVRRGERGHRDAAMVRVAAPTGNPAVDVPNIQAAVDAATPGALIQFARGTYAIEQETQFVISVPEVTLQGDRRGTTIRGVTACCPPNLSGHFLLTGGHQTVRRLTFEGFTYAVSMGAPGSTLGGYRLENNAFRNGHVAFDFVAFSDDVSTVEHNEFVNLTTPFTVFGKNLHFRHNRLAITDATQTPLGQPFQAGLFVPEVFSGGTVCENFRVEGNTIVGFNDGFLFFTVPDGVCRNNIVRDNEFIRMRIYNVFAPLFDNGTMAYFAGPGQHEGNLIMGNVLRGSEGVGLVLETGSRNRIIENEFSDLPGEKETFIGFPGTAIVLGAATTGNRVSKNEFKNVVNTIVDLGTRNIIKDKATDNLVAGSNPGLSLRRGESGPVERDHSHDGFARRAPGLAVRPW